MHNLQPCVQVHYNELKLLKLSRRSHVQLFNLETPKMQASVIVPRDFITSQILHKTQLFLPLLFGFILLNIILTRWLEDVVFYNI